MRDQVAKPTPNFAIANTYSILLSREAQPVNSNVAKNGFARRLRCNTDNQGNPRGKFDAETMGVLKQVGIQRRESNWFDRI